MKYFLLGLILILGSGLTLPAYAFQGGKMPADIDWEAIDAVEAMAIANAWKWSRKDIKSSVTAREVIFNFPDKTVKRIPLSEEKMLVAVAPYIRQTHR
jgi:hypothetical protein